MPQDETKSSDAQHGAAGPAGGKAAGVGMAGWVATALALAALGWLAWWYRGMPGGVGAAWSEAAWGRPWARGWSVPWASLKELAIGLAYLLALYGLGYGIIGRVGAWRRALPTVVGRLLFAPLASGVVVSLAVLGIGLAWGLNGAVLWLMFGLLLGGGAWGARAFWRDASGEEFRVVGDALSGGGKWLALATLPVVLLAVPYALTPAVESDELRYHLAAPATWLRMGEIRYLPHQGFSNFPMLAEMLFLHVYALAGGAGAAKLLHLGFLDLTCGLTMALALQWMHALGLRGGRRASYAMGAAALLATMPFVPVLAAWAFVDFFMTAYFLGFVYLGLVGLRQPGRFLASLLGVVAGGAAGVKYSMIPLLGGLGLVWLTIVLLHNRRAGMVARWAVTAGVFATLGGGAWLARNWAWTGNPVYPLGWGVFGGGEWSAEAASFYFAKASEKGYSLGWESGLLGRAVDLLATPWTTFRHEGAFEGHYLGPAPLLCAGALAAGGLMLACGGMRRLRAGGCARARLMWLGTALAGSWVFWFFSYQSNRLLLPTLALTLAGGAAMGGLWLRAMPPVGRVALRATVGLTVAVCLTLIVDTMLRPRGETGRADAVATALGFQEREHYLGRAVAYYPMAKRLERLAAEGEQALLVGEHRTMHFGLPVVASDWFDTPQPLPWIRETADNEAMLDALLGAGVRYVFLNAGELAKYREQYFRPRLSEGEYARFEALWTNPRLIERAADRRAGVFVYEIEERRE